MTSTARRFAVALSVALSATTAFVPAAALPTAALAQVPTDEPKYAAIVVDANSGEVLYARRADSPRYPASITKVMTLYLTYEALATGKLRLDDQITMSPRAAAQPPSKLGLAAGDRLTVEDAIQALTVRSANDVAVALAEKVGGTESRFAALMTLRAQELGMTNTRFVNANGLPDSRQISTARDIAILSRAVMRDFPQYYEFFGTKQWVFRGRAMNNTNGLLHRMPGVDGIKTGFTNASGYNLAASSVRDGKRLITVVLGGRTGRTRDDHVAELMTTGFEVFRRRKNGETITVAQNLFEQPTYSTSTQYASLGPRVSEAEVRAESQAQAVQYASLGIPVSDKDLTGALNAASLRGAQAADSIAGVLRAEEGDRLADVKPKAPARVAKAKAPAKPKRDPDAVWQVQVGAFKQKSVANDWLKDVGKRFKQHFREAEATIESGDGWYRARYQYLTKAAAADACRTLKAKRVPCLVMKV